MCIKLIVLCNKTANKYIFPGGAVSYKFRQKINKLHLMLKKIYKTCYTRKRTLAIQPLVTHLDKNSDNLQSKVDKIQDRIYNINLVYNHNVTYIGIQTIKNIRYQ